MTLVSRGVNFSTFTFLLCKYEFTTVELFCFLLYHNDSFSCFLIGFTIDGNAKLFLTSRLGVFNIIFEDWTLKSWCLSCFTGSARFSQVDEFLLFSWFEIFITPISQFATNLSDSRNGIQLVALKFCTAVDLDFTLIGLSIG